LLSNTISKLTIALLWSIPFFFPKAGRTVSYVALGYMVYFATRTLTTISMLVERSYTLPMFNVFTSSMLVILLLCCLFLVLRQLTDSGAEAKWRIEKSDDQGSASQPFHEAMHEMKVAYKLTSQELKILHLLAIGRNVKYISENLVVTANTTKSHMRNLYTKLDIHSQQELIDLADSFVKNNKKA
jgi:DNA-binding CsgD family transcriptional regulator